MDPLSTPATPKQQVVERLKSATNVLVTVSKNPSVDQLASLIGFTLMLNKLGKHATAVYSGLTPNTLEFLEPDDTIEKTTDSLRDFIISLDKSKADKLRYKVEDDVVKIFITPYKTNITDKDLVFSQGDFNVEAVVALGVDSRDDLDQAIIAHGRILHDATVMTINAGSQTSDLGVINWQEEQASSLCEMLVSISESFRSGLLDTQMATAFLTGIVAETARFSNTKTSPKVMTMSAQLMAAGANQQLIATKLNEHEAEADELTIDKEGPGSAPVDATTPAKDVATLSISHEHPEETKEAEEVAQEEKEEEEEKPTVAPEEGKIHIDDHGNMNHLEDLLEADEKGPGKRELGERMKTIDPLPPSQTATPTLTFTPPTFGGSLNSSISPLPEPSTDPLSHNQSNPAALPNVEAMQPLATAEPAMKPKTPDPIQRALDSLPPSTPAPSPIQLPPLPMPGTPVVPTPPVSPAVNPLDSAVSETLTQLEGRIDAHHEEPIPDPVEHVSLNKARDAVEQAIGTMPYDAARPDPIKALGSQQIDLNPVHTPAAPVPPTPQASDPMAPPPVPPPLMP